MAKLSAGQIATVAGQAGFRGQDQVIAVAVALAESGGNPDATNQNTDSHRSVDYGLWQINSYWNADTLRMGNWRDPVTNGKMAYSIFKSRGWRDWVTYKTGRYNQFMLQAASAVRNPKGITDVLPSFDQWVLGKLGIGGGADDVGGPFGDLKDAVPENPVSSMIEPARKAAEAVVKAGAWLGDQSNWIRVIKVALGGVLVVAGVTVAARPAIEQAAGSAVKIATKGKL